MKALAEWFERQQRDLPWRRTRDPYRIWVSEIMLQQTRVETVIDYYHRFLADFPTVHDLAAAPLDDVLKRWEGLGYYARARNLHKAARRLAERGEDMPQSRDALLALPGIGRYTAGAIASIAFGERAAAVDGNIERVLSRWYADGSSVWTRAEALIANAADPSAHNQALMELGATICTPRRPRCGDCPISADCRGQAEPERFPPRTPTRPLPRREVCAGVVWRDGRFLIVRRPEEGLLGGLWDLPSTRREGRERGQRTCARAVAELTGARVKVGRELAVVEHVFTHFRMHLRVFDCSLESDGGEGLWIAPRDRASYAFPQATRRIFDMVFEKEDEDKWKKSGSR